MVNIATMPAALAWRKIAFHQVWSATLLVVKPARIVRLASNRE
jgi:hypothetical protein